METPEPIKRSKALIPLSKDHHDGLLLVFKIRQGIKFNVTPERLSNYCSWFWNHHLIPHFDKEEEILGPKMKNLSYLRQQLFDEHQAIKEAVEKLGEENSYDNLESFANLLNKHIRFEERVLFTELEKSLTEDELRNIEGKLEDEERSCEIWADEFWKK